MSANLAPVPCPYSVRHYLLILCRGGSPLIPGCFSIALSVCIAVFSIIALSVVAFLGLDGSRVLRVQSVGVTRADTVVNTVAGLTVVGAIGSVPRLGVQSTVCALCNVRLGHDIGVEEVLRK